MHWKQYATMKGLRKVSIWYGRTLSRLEVRHWGLMLKRLHFSILSMHYALIMVSAIIHASNMTGCDQSYTISRVSFRCVAAAKETDGGMGRRCKHPAKRRTWRWDRLKLPKQETETGRRLNFWQLQPSRLYAENFYDVLWTGKGYSRNDHKCREVIQQK